MDSDNLIKLSIQVIVGMFFRALYIIDIEDWRSHNHVNCFPFTLRIKNMMTPKNYYETRVLKMSKDFESKYKKGNGTIYRLESQP